MSGYGNECEKSVYIVKKKINYLTQEELLQLDKQELVDKIIRLQAHNEQLRNILAKRKDISVDVEKSDETKSTISCVGKKKKRSFDFTKCRKRHIFLRFLYLGWDYRGLVSQEETADTIEEYIFNALIKACLIPDRQSSNYHRCGRTDTGVSSSGQVISLDVRSRLLDADGDCNDDKELPYCKMLNKLLPENIRIISWCPVPDNYSARFNCISRTYRYYFIKGQLNITEMSVAADYLVGEHDFRNFCKMDVGNGVVNFNRNIQSASIFKFSSNDNYKNGVFDVYQLKISANGFLWHQIRCIVTVLLLIGQNKETPDVVKELLDVSKYSRKPHYSPAHPVPLVLHDCQYDFEPKWQYSVDDLKFIVQQLQKNWAIHQIKASQVIDMISDIIKDRGIELPDVQTSGLIMGNESHIYKPLLERPLCESLESRIKHYVKKQRLEIKESQINDSLM